MTATRITENIHWVGAVDWGVRSFHGNTYTTRRGTSYNAYLIKDTHTTLVDAVYAPFTDELIANIRSVCDPAEIRYIVMNHVEPDHSGALPAILKLCPRAQVVGTAKCRDGLEKYYRLGMDFRPVKTGDTLSCGKHTITFVEAPMLHWPDSMFSYIAEEQLLLPNDAFGQHLASTGRFDDQVEPVALMEEAEKYYANILWPFSQLITAKLAEVAKLGIPIRMIAPSHGVIWRAHPERILSSYASWAKNTTQEKVVIAFESMWGSTEKMARRILDGVMAEGVRALLCDIGKWDRTDIITESLDARGIILGSSTHDNSMLPGMAGFMEFFTGLRPKGRLSAVFGSYGWSGGAVKHIEDGLTKAGLTLAVPSISVQYAPADAELAASYELGRAFARKIKEAK